MSLIGVVRNVIKGTEPPSDILAKLKELLTDDVVDPVETFGEQFASDFGKAALAEAGALVTTVGPELIAGTTTIAAQIPTILSTLEQQGIKIAETDALQDASTVVGNALRVQVTASQIQAAGNAASSTPSAPAAADTPPVI
jgi:hypothetical protein